MTLSRRAMCALVPGMFVAAAMQASERETGEPLLPSQTFQFNKLTVEGDALDHFIPVMEGSIHTGLNIRLHETELASGATAHALHKHRGEELFLVREGSLQVEIAGKISTLGPGSVAYVASNVEHATRNVSDGWVRYFAVLLGSAQP